MNIPIRRWQGAFHGTNAHWTLVDFCTDTDILRIKDGVLTAPGYAVGAGGVGQQESEGSGLHAQENDGINSVRTSAPGVALCTSDTHEIEGSIWETDGVLPDIQLFTAVPDYLSFESTNLPFVPLEVTLLKRKGSNVWDIIVRFEDQAGRLVWSRITAISAGFYPAALDGRMRHALKDTIKHVTVPEVPLSNGIALWLRCVSGLDAEQQASAASEVHQSAMAANLFSKGESPPSQYFLDHNNLRQLTFPVAVLPELIRLHPSHLDAATVWSASPETYQPPNPPAVFAILSSSLFSRHEYKVVCDLYKTKLLVTTPKNPQLPKWIAYRTPRTLLEAVKENLFNLAPPDNFWWMWDTVGDDINGNCINVKDEVTSPFKYILKSSQNVRTPEDFRPFYTKKASKLGGQFLAPAEFQELETSFFAKQN